MLWNIQVVKAESEANNLSLIREIPESFSIPPFPNTHEGMLAKEGYALVTKTYEFIGPNSLHPITGNHLSCSSCHLGSGTKPFAAPFIGLSGVYPQYLARDNKVSSLEDRINSCVERSLNGAALDNSSREMRAIVAYIKFLSSGTVIGERTSGQGFIKFSPPQRSADLKAGAKVFANNCAYCHGTKGEGQHLDTSTFGGYRYPPLWGADSFNDAAGMHRILTAAKFIKANMPLGVSASRTILSDEEAYDVAGFINSQPRPEKSGKDKDYPNLTKKPKDCPYPPYVDNIPQSQHQFGPFDFSSTDNSE
jgi:thiosulfate dehydrogenase